MVADRLGALGELRTLDEMTAALADEDRCRDMLEALVWPNGAVCPFCSGRNCRRRGGKDYAKGRWCCDEGVSSPRLAEFLGVTQATAWLLGHRLRLLMRHLNQPLHGTVEADLLQVGGKPRFDPAQPEAHKGKQGHTTERPVLTTVARPEGDRPGAAGAVPVAGGAAERKTRSGKVRTVRLWERLGPVTQMRELFAQALGRQIRRRRDGGFRLVEA